MSFMSMRSISNAEKRVRALEWQVRTGMDAIRLLVASQDSFELALRFARNTGSERFRMHVWKGAVNQLGQRENLHKPNPKPNRSGPETSQTQPSPPVPFRPPPTRTLPASTLRHAQPNLIDVMAWHRVAASKNSD